VAEEGHEATESLLADLLLGAGQHEGAKVLGDVLQGKEPAHVSHGGAGGLVFDLAEHRDEVIEHDVVAVDARALDEVNGTGVPGTVHVALVKPEFVLETVPSSHDVGQRTPAEQTLEESEIQPGRDSAGRGADLGGRVVAFVLARNEVLAQTSDLPALANVGQLAEEVARGLQLEHDAVALSSHVSGVVQSLFDDWSVFAALV